jgi:BolA family transcriptional regulator, general stress-responsive regulator
MRPLQDADLDKIKDFLSKKPMSVKGTIERKLTAAFPGAQVHVEDESHKHAGHAGARPEGETHFKVIIKADAFKGKTRVSAHRMVMACLTQELEGPVHALAIETSDL